VGLRLVCVTPIESYLNRSGVSAIIVSSLKALPLDDSMTQQDASISETDSLDAFIDRLRKSNLLTAEEYAKLDNQRRHSQKGLTVKEAANRMVVEKLLTRWQAEQLLAAW